jgi:hypothetical protein
MKNIVIIILVAFSLVSYAQDKKMTGKYKMEYDYSYGSQNGIINFDGDTYSRMQVNGKKIKGNVDYQKYFIFLNDKESHLQVKFPRREMGNDTIYFRTTDLSNKSVNDDELEVYGGKLIKIK